MAEWREARAEASGPVAERVATPWAAGAPSIQPLLKPLACAIPITGRARIARLYPIDFAKERRR